jgi:high-affinity iron transporter
MSQAFTITLGEGFEAFMIVALSVAYLRRTERASLVPAVYWGILASVLASGVVALLFQRAANHALWEGAFTTCAGLLAILLATDVWRTVTQREPDASRARATSELREHRVGFVAVFLLTLVMLTREGFEMVVLLQALVFQVRSVAIIAAAGGGIVASGAMAFLWARYGDRVHVAGFFQATGLFLALFIVTMLVYGSHELAEARILPDSEEVHEATEPFSPDGRFGHLFPYLIVLIPTLWVGISVLRRPAGDRINRNAQAV